MDSEEDPANVNRTPAEIPRLQDGQHNLEASRQLTDAQDVGIPLSNMHDKSETFKLLDFQDSQMSPALALLPSLDKSLPFSDSTFFQHTDAEFVALRGFPDLSVISERCPRMNSHVGVADDYHPQETIREQASLSQHPLDVLPALSEAEISCCSLSQHSLSPGDHYKIKEEERVSFEAENKIDRQMEGEEQSASQQLAGVSAVNINSAFASETPLDHPEPTSDQPNTSSMNIQTGLLAGPGSAVEHELQSVLSSSREQPQGGSSSLFQSSAVSNITVRDSRGHSHQTADRLRDQLYKGQVGSISEPGSRHHNGNRSSHSGLFVTPAGAGGMHIPGLQRLVWSAGNATASDGSFLSTHPVSQSTPAVPLVKPPPALTKLSLVHSQEDGVASAAASFQNSHSKTGLISSLDLSVLDQHSFHTGAKSTVTVPSKPSTASQTTPTESQTHTISKQQGSSPAPDVPSSDSQSFYTGTKMKGHVSHLALGRVQSLPSLSYLQKVDAWTANQTSSRSFYDNLALKAFDDVSLKNKSQDSVSGALKLSQDVRQLQLTQAPVSASFSGSGSPRRVDVIGAGVLRGQASESPVNHSHSSLNSVVTSIQRDTGSHRVLAQTDDIIPVLLGKNNRSAALQDKSTVKPSPLASLGRFSDVSSSFNMSSTLSSSHGSYHGEQSMRASVGAGSSVMSLEVDNYAPYWTSRPTSPPQSRELNIEDRIPLYLLNLGIDQSPSTILNPFTLRGPIREPEFSPTDLCTIKGSIGTPTKSTQPSEVDTPQNEAFSSSSQLSADSSASVSYHLSVHQQDQAIGQQSGGTILSQPDTPPRHHSILHPSSNLQHSDTPPSEGSFGPSSELSPDSVAPAVPREEVKEDDPFVGSGTLHEIRRLLGRAESLVSGRSSLTSSPGSHRLSESDTSLVSLGRNTQGCHDGRSLSASGNFSLLLTRSSSDSALKASSASSQGAHQPSTQTDFTSKPDALSLSRDESLKSRDLCVTPRRAEPEGCSAADPDKAKQTAARLTVQSNVPLMTGNFSYNQDDTENAVVGSSGYSPSHASADAESLSDSSSENSLAARVGKLLQSESPVSMVTSRPSTADPEDRLAREWILLKVSGRHCESLELNPEDRKRIEDIKRELLLNTQHTKWSSDSEGSAPSGVGAGSQPGKDFVGMPSMDSHVSDARQKTTQKPLDSNVLLYTPEQRDLEARVHQIALREGFSPPTITSISIATTRHSPSPQLPSDCSLTGTVELGNVDARLDMLQLNGHHKGTDTNPEVFYPQLRHQPGVIPNAFDREEQTEGESKSKGDNEEIIAEDNEENTVKNDSHIVQEMSDVDYNITGRNQIMSGVASDTAPDNKSHLSHIHVTLSPKPKHQSHSVEYHSSRLSSQNSFKDVPLARESPLITSTGTEQQQFNLISHQARSFEHNEQFQIQNKVNPNLQSRYPQAFTSTQKMAGTSRTLAVQAAAVRTLLPYKPHGSSELFYVPQADPELSHDRSDTTVESSHSGSDDAVPPRFNKHILGSRELEDNPVMPKHKEGIYSKRASEPIDSSSASRRTFKESTGRYNSTAPQTSYVSVKDVGDEDHFVPLYMEEDYSTDDLHLHNRTMQEPKLPLEPQHVPSQPIRRSGLNKNRQDRTPHDVSVEISSSLDQLWRRFNEKWSVEDTQPTNEGDTSLLDRLERLSRLIHSTTPTNKTVKQPDRTNRIREKRGDKEEGTRTEEGVERERVAPRQVWAEHEDNPQNVQRCPAERDESSSVSMETSSTMSTIDTERLVRAFGHHRVTSKGLKNSNSLLRLNTINKQKTSRRKPGTKHAAVSTDADNISTDDSTVTPDYLSSSSTLSMNSQSVTTKRSKVKLHSKSVQAGDLEIVINGTRRHTRDVGTIFPSPGASRNDRTPNTHNNGVQGVPVPTASSTNSIQSHSVLKRDSSNKSIQTRYPNGLSWFVTTDELKSDGRKENQPQSEAEPCRSQAWFEPHSKTQPGREPARKAIREPLRERQIQEEQEKPRESRTAVGSDGSDRLSALVRLSLQEALELHRPEFVSRSRERMKRLELLVEERRLQTVFNREREELFNCPAPSLQLIQAAVPRKRVVPRREMVQRSKQKYAQLPEIRKRREEEKRQAEHSSYRLNAQLFNKKVTNHVLGRRAPWQ
ncbi:uncharacterized protein alms1 isoform X2 [Triplophysa dalaica]|uniref:uncharacterized protein alms1 isoform X2 n=1 Tax=Triplophysa dalaica TaxID=1582913 RepID=UPI0024DF64C6|nr:uncharacterized protein alms1 isoform X2 [Triplophysa dalaica]